MVGNISVFSNLATFWEEAGAGGTDALVPSARWQEGEESMRRVGGVIHRFFKYPNIVHLQ